jgi:hypothetical protein
LAKIEGHSFRLVFATFPQPSTIFVRRGESVPCLKGMNRRLRRGTVHLATPTEQLFVIESDEELGGRRFVRVVPRNSDSLVEALAPLVRDAYFTIANTAERLRQAAEELTRFDGSGLVVTELQIATALEDQLDAMLPAAWRAGGRPQQTDPQRSELAEIIAANVVQTLFGTLVPASRIARKEVPDQQTRGVDIFGFENIRMPDVTFVIAEVKGSCEAASPPGVVADMANKLPQLATNRRRIIQELAWIAENSDDEFAKLCQDIHSYYLLKILNETVLMVPILLRTTFSAGTTDYGRFAPDGDKFDFPVRFIGVIVEAEDLFELARAVYEQARRLAPA